MVLFSGAVIPITKPVELDDELLLNGLLFEIGVNKLAESKGAPVTGNAGEPEALCIEETIFLLASRALAAWEVTVLT